MPDDRRNALLKLPYRLAVNPNGRFVKVRLAKNVANPVFALDDGEWILRSRARREGWLLPEDVLTKAQVKELVAFFEFDEAHGGRVRPFPDAHLPDKIRRMRSAAAQTPSFFDDPAPAADVDADAAE
jgi:hypothetical protein